METGVSVWFVCDIEATLYIRVMYLRPGEIRGQRPVLPSSFGFDPEGAYTLLKGTDPTVGIAKLEVGLWDAQHCDIKVSCGFSPRYHKRSQHSSVVKRCSPALSHSSYLVSYVRVHQNFSVQYKWEQNENALLPLLQLMSVFELCQYLFMKTACFPIWNLFVRAAQYNLD